MRLLGQLLGLIFFTKRFRTDQKHRKAPKAQKAQKVQKAQKRNHAKVQNATSKQK